MKNIKQTKHGNMQSQFTFDDEDITYTLTIAHTISDNSDATCIESMSNINIRCDDIAINEDSSVDFRTAECIIGLLNKLAGYENAWCGFLSTLINLKQGK